MVTKYSNEKMKFGILTVSDTCSHNENLDKSGPKIIQLIEKYFADNVIAFKSIVPDDADVIKQKLIQWSDESCDVVFTTGGTGIAPRDVTPDATKAVIEREVPGISYAMISNSLAITPFAMLSRAICGIRKKTLIINFPGSEKAVEEHFNIVKEIIPHAISLINDDFKNVTKTHEIDESKNIDKSTPSKVKLNSVASRDRTSPYPMVEVNAAYSIIFNTCPQDSETEQILKSEALGRVLAEDVLAFDPLPPYPASIKDGYAVRVSDGVGPRKVQHAVNAGENCAIELSEGHCIRISTGAQVPPGADAVVQIEDTELLSATVDNNMELEIDIKVAPTVGQDIRKIGSDIEAQSVILKKGIVLNPAEIGILAAVGNVKVKVYRQMNVGVISTGNELQRPEEPLQPGQIRDSNKDTIINLLKKYGFKGEDFGIVKDDPTSVKLRLEKALETSDMVITTGGVSMGEHDVIKQVLKEDFNAIIRFGRVNMKPGKPTTFATCVYKGKLKMIFALPGNPVSATVTCLLFVIPALRYHENRANVHFPSMNIPLQYAPEADKDRPEYQRVKLQFDNQRVIGCSTGNQISSRLNSFTGANGLVCVPISDTYRPATFYCYLLENF